jgi:hypothetical protein
VWIFINTVFAIIYLYLIVKIIKVVTVSSTIRPICDVNLLNNNKNKKRSNFVCSPKYMNTQLLDREKFTLVKINNSNKNCDCNNICSIKRLMN